MSQRVVSGLSDDYVQGRIAFVNTEKIKFKSGWLTSISSIAYDSLFGTILGQVKLELANIVDL